MVLTLGNHVILKHGQWFLAEIEIRERVWLGHGTDDHLATRDQIENDIARIVREYIELDQNQEETGLPEGEEQDGLHCDKLVEGSKGRKSFFCGHVE